MHQPTHKVIELRNIPRKREISASQNTAMRELKIETFCKKCSHIYLICHTVAQANVNTGFCAVDVYIQLLVVVTLAVVGGSVVEEPWWTLSARGITAAHYYS